MGWSARLAGMALGALVAWPAAGQDADLDRLRALGAEELEGRTVVGAGGEEIGEVADVLDFYGDAPSVVVEAGGVLGLGDQHVVLPLAAFRLTADGLHLPGATAEELEAYGGGERAPFEIVLEPEDTPLDLEVGALDALAGTSVVGEDGAEIGEVDAVGRFEGRPFAVVELEGTLGADEISVPLERFRRTADGGLLLPGASEATIEALGPWDRITLETVTGGLPRDRVAPADE